MARRHSPPDDRTTPGHGPPPADVFTYALGRVRATVHRAPLATAALAVAGLLLTLLLLPVLAAGSTAPPRQLVTLAAVLALVAVVRLARAAWPLRHRNSRARLTVDAAQLTVTADGYTTRVPWSDVSQVGVRHDVPPRPGRPTLVATLHPDAPHPPDGSRLPVRLADYEPHPRWYRRPGVVRLADLTQLAATPDEVRDAVRRVAGERWSTAA